MAVSPVFAQKALVKVEYLENYRNWTDANVTNDFLLLAGIEESRLLLSAKNFLSS